MFVFVPIVIEPIQEFKQPATREYQVRNIEGFTVLVSPSAQKDLNELKPALKLLGVRLRQVKQEVPPGPFVELRKVKFWVEVNDPKSTAVYHPSAEWLKANGYNPDMAHCIEIGNLKNFLAWQHIQPSMVLHELSHAYHFQKLGEGFEPILEAYKHAVQSHIYDSVPFVGGGNRKSYALTNAFEYFAECSEAYFGRNDFFPFLRSELKKFDPEGYAAVEAAWYPKK